MSRSSSRPRPDQIAELTGNVSLPLLRTGTVFLEIIAECLLLAFTDLLDRLPHQIASGSEPEITALMEARLQNLINEDRNLGSFVLCVARGKESLSFDGSQLEKRPDLSIYLTNGRHNFPLILEAKILDTKKGKTVTRYCEEGIRQRGAACNTHKS